MLPGMATPNSLPDPGRWVTVKFANGRAAHVATYFDHGQEVVVVKPIRQNGGTPNAAR